MKNKLLLLGAFSICSLRLIAQQDQETISTWQKSNPGVSFISEESFSALTISERTLLGNYIVFKDKIEISDLVEFDAQNANNSNVNSKQPVTDTGVIKQWLSNHQEIDVIPFSLHSTFSAEKLAVLNESGSLLLSGENVTLADIQNYPY